jgi:hypothetical protein
MKISSFFLFFRIFPIYGAGGDLPRTAENQKEGGW